MQSAVLMIRAHVDLSVELDAANIACDGEDKIDNEDEEDTEDEDDNDQTTTGKCKTRR